MAMTKKEKEHWRMLLEKVEIIAALRWSDNVEPDLSPEKDIEKDQINGIYSSNKYISGFIYNSYAKSVEEWWSSRIYSGPGLEMPEKLGIYSRKPSRLFSTKLLALRALRYDLCRRFARELWEIDKRIEQEEGSA